MNQYNSIDPYGTYDVKGLSPYEMAMKMASWNQSLRSTLVKTNEDLSSVQSTISQHADAIGLRVLKEDYTGEIIASMIVIDPYAIGLIAENIDITGYVTFSDLAQSGKTTIHGGNIISKSITSGQILVGELSAISSNLGYINAGHIYGLTVEAAIISGGTINGVTMNSGTIQISDNISVGRYINIGYGLGHMDKGIMFTGSAASVQAHADTLNLYGLDIWMNGRVDFRGNTVTGLQNASVGYAANAGTVGGIAGNQFMRAQLSHQGGTTFEFTASQMIVRTPSGTTLRFNSV